MEIGFAGGAVFCVAFAFVAVRGGHQLFGNQFRYLKGTKLKKPMLQKADATHRYLWGNQFLSFDQARKHFLAVGSPGSGKTINILLLLKTVLARMCEEGSDVRAMLYDSKTDLLPYVAAVVPPEKIRVLNPLDARCHAWDMAKDITDSAMADDIASVLIPTEKDAKDPYFTRTAQRLLAGILEAFMARGNEWTLRDVILATKTPERLRAVFESCPETEDLLQHFEPETTFRNVKSTLDGVLRGYRGIAAVWERALKEGRSFHINDVKGNGGAVVKGWISSREVLVMGNSPRAKTPISRVNQLLFTQVAKAILERPGYSQAEHWIFLDEFRELGRLDNISDLMITGRSKGAAVVLGFQDISGVEDIYGEKQGREIVGCTQNIAIVHINNSQPNTQEWASRILGDTTYISKQKSESTSFGQGGSTTSNSTTFQRLTEKQWLPSQFSVDLPPASLQGGMTGLYKSTGPFYLQPFPGDVLFGSKGTTNRVPPKNDSYPDREPIDSEALTLGDWSADDLLRLKIPALKAWIARDEAQSDVKIVERRSLDSFARTPNQSHMK